MQLLQTGVIALPFDIAAANTIRLLSLMKHKSLRLTVVMMQALREHYVTQYSL